MSCNSCLEKEDRFTVRKGAFLALAIFIVIYVIWLIVAGIFIFPLCANCPIEALWAILWVVSLASTVFVGYYGYQDIVTPDGLRKLSKSERIAVRTGYGFSAFFVLVWIVILIAYAAVFTNVGASVNGSAKISGIQGDIQIGMGKNQLLSVTAADELDALYGLGWAHATYRSFQMDIQRRVGQGRLSEVVGKAGLDVDKFSLTTGFYAAAVRGLPDFDPSMIMRMQAYVNGVNDQIRGNYKHSIGFRLLGFKPQPVFTVADILTYAKLVSYQLSGNWNSEIGRFQDHVGRGVSGVRLDQLDPMDPQTTTTVISDAALGNRYDGLPVSNHRNVSLQYEVERLDAYMATAGFASAKRDFSSSSSDSELDAFLKMKRKEYEQQQLDLQTERRRKGEDVEDEQHQRDQHDSVFLSDLLSMLNLGASSAKDDFVPAGVSANKWKSMSVLERAKRRFPSFFSVRRGFMKASNNWVVHGSRTNTGSPFLCNDPHLALSIPSIWIVAAMNTSRYNAMGSTFPGMPGIPIGHNEYIAWGVTNSGMDVQDLYILDEVNATAYRHNGMERLYDWRFEKIPVKGSATIDWPVRESLYGPVINPIYGGTWGHSISMRWTTLERNDTTVIAFYNLLPARNWTDFREALSHYVAPAQNFVYADIYGNIGYQLPGPIPIRVDNHTGTYPVPGNGSFDWVRKSDFWNESLWVFNPPERYIVSANNMIATSKYPLNILNDRDWESRYRATRITQLVNSPYLHSKDDMRTIQQDTTSLFALEFVNGFRLLQGLNSAASTWLDQLKAWDGNEVGMSKEALVFEAIWSELGPKLQPETDEDWGNPRYWLQMIVNNTFPDPVCVADGYDCTATISRAFNDALKNRGIGSSSKKTWGNQHGALLKNDIFGDSAVACLFNRKKSTGGSPFTVNVATYNLTTLQTYEGPSYRQILDLNDWANSDYIIPGGPQEDIISSYYADLFKPWAEGQYLPLNLDSPYSISKFTIKPK